MVKTRPRARSWHREAGFKPGPPPLPRLRQLLPLPWPAGLVLLTYLVLYSVLGLFPSPGTPAFNGKPSARTGYREARAHPRAHVPTEPAHACTRALSYGVCWSLTVESSGKE